MRRRTAYLTFSKICFFTALFSLAITIISFHVFAHYNTGYEDTVIDNQCYWEYGIYVQWWTFECGKDILFGGVISFIINFGYYAFLPVMEPILLLILPPILSAPFILGYVLIISYPAAIIHKKYYTGSPKEASDKFFLVIKWFFILFFLLVFVLQGAIMLHLIKWG